MTLVPSDRLVKMIRSLAPLACALLVSAPLVAQHQHEDHATGYDLTLFVEGTALTADQITELRTGAGAGLALPAEINSYPGPKHVLEHAAGLGLTDEQATAVEGIRVGMNQTAVDLGTRVIAAERHLASLFASASATPEAVVEATRTVADLRGQLQAAHLIAHLRTRAVLTAEQVAAYDRLRGYR